MALGQQTQTTVCRVGSINAGTDDERPVFVAPFKTTIRKIRFVSSSDVSADGTDYTTVDIQDKGSDGSGTDSVASFNTNSNDGDVSLTGFDPYEISVTYTLDKGNALSLKKSDSGAGQAFDEVLVEIVYEASPGLNWNDY